MPRRRRVVDVYPTEDVRFEDLHEGPNARLFYTDIPELAASIATQGLIEPPVVRPKDEAAFEIIAGFRRMRAIRLVRECNATDPNRDEKRLLSLLPENYSKYLGPKRFKILNVAVFEGDDLEALCINIGENTGRRDLGVYELGLAFKKFREEHDLSPAEISERLGYSKGHVNNCLRVIDKGCEDLLHALKQNAERRMSSAFTQTRIFRIASIADPAQQRTEVMKLWNETRATRPDKNWLDKPKKKRQMLGYRKAASLLVEMEELVIDDPQAWTKAIEVTRYLMGLGPSPVEE